MRARRTRCALVALLVGACAPATAPAPRAGGAAAETELPIPAGLRSHVEKAARIGEMLYALDTASAMGTDMLVAKVPDHSKKGIGGYLTLREGDGDGPKDAARVVFFSRETPPRLLYEVRVKAAPPADFTAFDPPRPAPEAFAALVRARQLALEALPAVRQPMNPVLLPAALNDEKGTLVYLLAGTKTPNVAVFGQHFRVLVPDGGGAPSYVMPLSKTMLEVPVGRKGPNGEAPVGLVVSHVLTEWPLETHVFVSLQFHTPVYVVAGRWVWRVDGARIALVEDRGTPPAAPAI